MNFVVAHGSMNSGDESISIWCMLNTWYRIDSWKFTCFICTARASSSSSLNKQQFHNYNWYNDQAINVTCSHTSLLSPRELPGLVLSMYIILAWIVHQMVFWPVKKVFYSGLLCQLLRNEGRNRSLFLNTRNRMLSNGLWVLWVTCTCWNINQSIEYSNRRFCVTGVAPLLCVNNVHVQNTLDMDCSHRLIFIPQASHSIYRFYLSI